MQDSSISNWDTIEMVKNREYEVLHASPRVPLAMHGLAGDMGRGTLGMHCQTWSPCQFKCFSRNWSEICHSTYLICLQVFTHSCLSPSSPAEHAAEGDTKGNTGTSNKRRAEWVVPCALPLPLSDGLQVCLSCVILPRSQPSHLRAWAWGWCLCPSCVLCPKGVAGKGVKARRGSAGWSLRGEWS